MQAIIFRLSGYMEKGGKNLAHSYELVKELVEHKCERFKEYMSGNELILAGV